MFGNRPLQVEIHETLTLSQWFRNMARLLLLKPGNNARSGEFRPFRMGGIRPRLPAMTNSQLNIVLVEDDPDISRLVQQHLERADFSVRAFFTGAGVIAAAEERPPALFLLDIMVPDGDGLELCSQIRRTRALNSVPVIFLTAKGGEANRILGLELGADDYITKPFSPRVLVARIRAVLRRKLQQSLEDPTTIKIHELVIHPGRHEVLLRGQPLELTFTEFRLLQFLARKPGWAYSRGQIVDAVKGEDYPGTERSVDVQVAGLRKKLGALGSYIETVRGVGYRFKE